VRHGRSTYNEQGRYQGASDAAVLTNQGFQDALQTGRHLQNVPVAAIYSSPLQRAQQTAQAIAQVHKFSSPSTIALHPQLQEIHLPEWAGLTYREVREHRAADYRCWIEHPDQFQMHLPDCAGVLTAQGDASPLPTLPFFPVRSLYAQAQQFWQDILPRHAGQTILMVSHGGTIRALIGTALGLSCQQFHRLQQSNCGISVLEFPCTDSFRDNQPAQLLALNDTHHLGEILPKLKEGKQGLRLLLASTDAVTPEAQQCLQEQLNPIDLHLCVSQGDRAQTIAHQLLQTRPEVVQLQSACPHIHHRWLETLRHQSQPEPAALTTGLLIAQPEVIQQLLSQVAGLEPLTPPLLSLAAHCLSIVHFPAAQRSVLQSLNFAHGQSLLDLHLGVPVHGVGRSATSVPP
jgi:probable phosphoglycerate mutase